MAKKVAYIKLIEQFIFILNVQYHLYCPRSSLSIILLLLQTLNKNILEVIYFIVGDFTFKYNQSFDLATIPLVYIYSCCTDFNKNCYSQYLLPTINFISFLRFIQLLRLFSDIRLFLRVLVQGLKQLSGFLKFLFVMLMCFTTTYNIIDRIQQRDLEQLSDQKSVN